MPNNTITYYEYDSNGRLLRARLKENTTTGSVLLNTENKFDDLGRAVKSVYDLQKLGETMTYTVTYKGNADIQSGRIASFGLPNGKSISYGYDKFDRLTSKSMGLTASSGIAENYSYWTSGNKTANLITSHSLTTPGGSIAYNYTYDDYGNILTVKEGSTLKLSYVYDELNQLTRENNAYANKTYVYTYDKNGNILTKKTYAYTTGTLGSVQNTVNYTYGNSSWKDLLTNYNGTAISYDGSGNPINWRGSITSLTWNGRQLNTLRYGSNTYTYTYNSDGIRTQKALVYDGISMTSFTHYILDGTKVVAQYQTSTSSVTPSNVIYFYYDESGSPTGMKYNGNVYYFQKNLQGDIIRILNSSGTIVATYTYDAWGNIIASTDTSGVSIGTKNPFRYRGYYYDTETGLYYLNSRYYDPQVGRFLNADSFETLAIDLENFSQYNLFTYGFNNPVNYSDSNGMWPNWATKVLIGTAVIAAAAVLTVATAGTGTTLACFALGALKGAAVGAAIGAASGAASGAISHRISTGSWDGAGQAALEGAADGYMMGAITGFISGGLSSNACFIAGTVILISEGSVAIENIKPGDYVWASDPKTGEAALKRVVQTFVNVSNELVHVEVDGEEIICTNEHPFYSPVKGWIAACELRVGDILVTVDGEHIIVENVQFEILETPVTVYNFEVEDFHTYYVGDTNVLVHNMCKPQKIYNSIKDAPNYNANFIKAQNGLKKVRVNNQELLQQLNQLGSGWKKVYQNGWINGQKVSLHYFQDASGKIFDFAIKYGKWS